MRNPDGARVLVLVALAACGAARPQPSWIEHDVDQPHAATPPVAAPTTAVEAPGDTTAASALERARLAEHVGDLAAARAWLARARAAPDAAAHRDALAALDAALTDRSRPGAIAVLLPLSGRHAALGAELRAAIELAAAGRRGATATWTWLDTAGDEVQAVAMVDRAADAGAVAILGPVGERESLAAARRAAERRVPIGLLAPADGADPAAGVFRLATSPADEARAAAQIAIDLQIATVAVLAPRDDIGAAMAAAFAAAARAGGLTVAAEGSYDPTARSLEPDVKRFLGLDPASNPRLRAHLHRHGKTGWQTFSPDIPFALLYVPDQHDRAALVASYLPYLGVEVRTREIMDPLLLRRKHRGRIPQVVQLVGSSGWNHSGLVPRGGAAVEGALIVDVHAGELDPGASGELAARFRDRTGRPPSSAAAQAHDAALLLMDAVAAARPGRAAAIAALARARLDDGACGPAQIDPAGELARAPVVLEVDSGEIVLAPL